MAIMFWVLFLFFSWLFISQFLKLMSNMGFNLYVFLFVSGLLILKICCIFRGKKSGNEKEAGSRKIKGTVVLMRKHVLGIKDIKASLLNRIHEIFGFGISMQLISSVQCDPEDESRGKPGNASYVEKWLLTITSFMAEETSFPISFEWDEAMGLPGAILVKNYHHSEFFLKKVTLKDVPGHGDVNFICDSWVYPVCRYTYHRVFFSNKSYLPCEIPELLRHYREEDLKNLRGDGTGELKEWDRVYDYAFYNDLGSPEKGADYVRPVLGGTQEYPYPRRGRTGRPIQAKNTEKRLPLLSLDIYVPCDERFRHLKFLSFLAYALKALIQLILPAIATLWKERINEFDSFDEVRHLYRGSFHLPKGFLTSVRERIRWEFFRELLRSDGEQFLKFPIPAVVKDHDSAWRTDEEFGREMLAGVNPVVIRRLEVFPPVSKLDVEMYGNQHSSIKEEHIKKYIEPLSIHEAIEQNKMFILDHHDAIMPYLSRINTTGTKTYATRTLLFLQENRTLKPVVIELSLPHPQGRSHGCISKVFTAPTDSTLGKKDVQYSIWQLAKAYAAVNDSGYHQLISHWLNTHAVIEPFIIATNRQLSVVHPIYKLLEPHFLDTMNINALARQTLINAGGVLERTVFPGKFAMEMSSFLYKDWVFTDHALPVDLLKRGVAIKVESDPVHYPYGLKLLIPDYPFANDGLEIWFAIKTWVSEYCHLYYHSSNEAVASDSELQSWWTEIRTEGHGDRKDATWWPTLDTLETLTETLTTIIWIASALHAAVNFGQYPYAGYLPNRPTVSRRFMPEPGTPEFKELEDHPDRAFLKTITARFQTLLGVSLIEVLSRQSAEEVYLGQRETPEWTADSGTVEAFERFRKKLEGIEVRIAERNRDVGLRNRVGPVNLPYTLLHPNTSNTTNKSTGGGLTGTGIPNSISI